MRLLTVILAAALSSGCVHRGFFTDGTSVALGRADRGALRHARELPASGAGYVTPGLWSERGNRFGTDELVAAIQRAAARVAAKVPGGLLGVGDLSRRSGGRMPFHRSHENGRDADLIFYATDELGVPVAPVDAMPRYNRHLASRPPRESTHTYVSPRLFDVARNWLLVAALVDDPEVDVEYLFISEPLREALLEYARLSGEREYVIERAKRALRQPGGHVPPHDDHLHLRIKCASSDRSQGCVDVGRVRTSVERWQPVDPRASGPNRRRRNT